MGLRAVVLQTVLKRQLQAGRATAEAALLGMIETFVMTVVLDIIASCNWVYLRWGLHFSAKL